MRQTRSSDTLAVLMIPLTAAGFILIFPPRHDCSLPVSAKPEGYAAVAAFFVYQQERDFRRVYREPCAPPTIGCSFHFHVVHPNPSA